MARIAISYRRMDTGGYAGRLYESLSARFSAHEVFMDISDLEPGVDFVEAIERAVSSCDALLVLIGPHWLTASDQMGRRLDNPEDFVRLEVGTALKRGIRVIPVLIQGTPMPRSDQLPPELASLARRQACEISDGRWRYDVGQLTATLERALGTLASTAPAEQPSAMVEKQPATVQKAPATVAEASERRLDVHATAAPTGLGVLVPAAWILGGVLGELLYDSPWRLQLETMPGPSIAWAAAGALGGLAVGMALTTRPARPLPWSRVVVVAVLTALACALVEWLCTVTRAQMGLLDIDTLGVPTLLGAVAGALVTGLVAGSIAHLAAAQLDQGQQARRSGTFASALIAALGLATGVAFQWGHAFEELRVAAWLLAAAFLGWLVIRERQQPVGRREDTARQQTPT